MSKQGRQRRNGRRSDVWAPDSAMTLSPRADDVAAVATILWGLSHNQREFLGQRGVFDTDSECARAVGVTPGTVRRWRRTSEDFRFLDDLRRNEPPLFARARLVLLTPLVVTALGRLLAEGAPPATQLRAIERILKSRDVRLLGYQRDAVVEEEDNYTIMMRQLASRRVELEAAREVLDVDERVEDDAPDAE